MRTVTIEVKLEAGGAETVEVNAIKVSQFPHAFSAYDAEDEARLVEISTGRHPGWANLLCVESYNEVVAAVYEVNSTGFFAYAGRRTASRVAKAAFAEQLRGQSRGPTTSPTSARPQA